MTADHDRQSDVGMEQLADREELDSPLNSAIAAATGGSRTEALALAGGGLVLLSGIRSLARGQRRGLLKGVVGAGLIGIGLRQRRSDDRSTFEPSTDEIDGGTEGKEISDAAHAAAERPDSGRESQIDASGEIDDSAQLGDEGDTGSRIEFTDDGDESESHPKPGLDGDDEDPRRDTDDDSVTIDVSDSAMAEEMSEATGPDPEQAQPTQTDAIEPEETPEEDASEMKVDPDDGDDESGTSTGDENGADGDTDETEK
ncbi:MSCRAMM family adhesin SdrC [Halosolutus amylolyticus]|uniref:MSCRAMM family adhesin SdrC n=1 Tax=Halosolutus amylolyticus TaxID=2932267 RepID=A0ABD5PR67_9EURY|nr:MSCRAMM family adhesin SdrC [Halosolutus amylolyticus]